MKRSPARGGALLALTALIWGFGFVAQSAGLSYIGPFTMNGVRSLIAGLVLLPVIPLMDRLSGRRPSLWGAAAGPAQRRTLLRGGLACGLALAAASSLQQVGIAYTTVGKAGFLTALYILLVPLLGIFRGHRPAGRLWIAVGAALAGMYLLCAGEGFSIGLGDGLMLLSALGFAVHILVIDHFADKTDGVRMSCIQFFVCGALCCGVMAFTEKPTAAALAAAWAPVLYAGAVSAGAGYTLQILGQRELDPTVASLILSLESVFAALGGWLLLGQSLSGRELAGCALVFAAILLAQLPVKGKSRRQDHDRDEKEEKPV